MYNNGDSISWFWRQCQKISYLLINTLIIKSFDIKKGKF